MANPGNSVLLSRRLTRLRLQFAIAGFVKGLPASAAVLLLSALLVLSALHLSGPIIAKALLRFFLC